MADLRLVANNGQTVPEGFNPIAESFYAIADAIAEGRLEMEQAIVVAVVEGGVTYTPIGHVSIVEGVGLLEMASRKIERDALGE